MRIDLLGRARVTGNVVRASIRLSAVAGVGTGDKWIPNGRREASGRKFPARDERRRSTRCSTNLVAQPLRSLSALEHLQMDRQILLRVLTEASRRASCFRQQLVQVVVRGRILCQLPSVPLPSLTLLSSTSSLVTVSFSLAANAGPSSGAQASHDLRQLPPSASWHA